MLVYEGVGLLLVVALWIFCLVDVIVSKEDECQNLPKLVWLLIVLMLPDVGSVLWLIAGRPKGLRQSWQQRTLRQATGPGMPRTAPRTRMPSAGSNPDDDEEFLRSIRRPDE
ncbi:MAG TPA: PLD nuclease N-terminal domain-containing protein [Acidothermaceae bacterium]